jgi:hypothetical protein
MEWLPCTSRYECKRFVVVPRARADIAFSRKYFKYVYTGPSHMISLRSCTLYGSALSGDGEKSHRIKATAEN